MPELPEVETVCLALSKILINSRVSNIEIFRKDLRWNIKDNLEIDLKQKTLKKPHRRGKYILIPTSNEHILLFHLGMSGTIKIISEEYDILKHDHVKIDIETREKNFFQLYIMIQEDLVTLIFLVLAKLKTTFC